MFKIIKKYNLNLKLNFKIVIFSISTLVFVYLLYLSIPSLYNTGRVQKVLSSEINSNFDLNLSLSPEISYRILPKPHFVINDAKLFNIKSEVNNEIGQIKELKIYISNKYFFNKEKIKINKITIQKANFFFKKDDLIYVKNYLNDKLIDRNIKILNSKVFYNDKENNTVFIYTIKKSTLKFYDKEGKNQINSDGEIFKIPVTAQWEKNFNSKSKALNINFKKINIDLENKSIFKDDKYIHHSVLNIFNSKLKSSLEFFANHIKFNSKNSIIRNTPISYTGRIDLKPFYIDTEIKAKQFDLNYLLKKSFWLDEIISSNFFRNENFNGKLNISSSKIIKNKIFDKINFVLNFDEGNLNFNETILSGSKIGSIKVFNSNFIEKDGRIFLEANARLDIEQYDLFYKKFFISKSNRKKFKNIEFSFNFDALNGSFYINRIIFYDLNGKRFNSELIDEIVDENADKSFSYFNMISFRNYLNKVLLLHSELG